MIGVSVPWWFWSLRTMMKTLPAKHGVSSEQGILKAVNTVCLTGFDYREVYRIRKKYCRCSLFNVKSESGEYKDN